MAVIKQGVGGVSLPVCECLTVWCGDNTDTSTATPLNAARLRQRLAAPSLPMKSISEISRRPTSVLPRIARNGVARIFTNLPRYCDDPAMGVQTPNSDTGMTEYT